MPFERLDSVDYATAGFSAYLVVDTVGGFLYAAISATNQAKVLKIQLSDFTVVSAITLEDEADYVGLTGGVISGDFIYYGSSQKDAVIKLNLSDLSVADSLLLSAGSQGTNALLINGTDLYAGTDGARIYTIDLNTFTESGVQILVGTADQKKIRSLTTEGGYLYMGTTDGRIHRMLMVSPGEPAWIDSLGTNLETGFSDENGNVYFGAKESGITVLYKIATSSFSIVGTLTINTDSQGVNGSFVDVGNGLAYLGTVDSTEFNYVKINLDSFTVVDTITGLGGGSPFIEAVIGIEGVAVDSTTFASYLATNAGTVGNQDTRIVKFDTFVPPADIPKTGGSLLKRPPTLFDYQTAMSRR